MELYRAALLAFVFIIVSTNANNLKLFSQGLNKREIFYFLVCVCYNEKFELTVKRTHRSLVGSVVVGWEVVLGGLGHMNPTFPKLTQTLWLYCR